MNLVTKALLGFGLLSLRWASEKFTNKQTNQFCTFLTVRYKHFSWYLFVVLTTVSGLNFIVLCQTKSGQPFIAHIKTYFI